MARGERREREGGATGRRWEEEGEKREGGGRKEERGGQQEKGERGKEKREGGWTDGKVPHNCILIGQSISTKMSPYR